MFPVLETDRLYLRSISSCDIDTIYTCWMQDTEVSKYMWWSASIDINETKRFVEYELSNIGNPDWIRWMIILNDTNELIGTCLLYYNDEEDHYDISYNLGRKYQGNGYITEAMQEVLAYARKRNIKEISTSYAKENLQSKRVLDKLGFQYVKDISYPCNGGKFVTDGAFVTLKL